MSEANKELVRRFYAAGTGDLAGLEAKGNALRIAAISTFRVANGRLAEGWELFDSGDMARQMQA
jgi:predicted ester cyclase